MRLRPRLDRSTAQRLLPSLLAAVLAMLVPRPAAASIIITVQSVTASAGSTGNALDVTLTNTGPGAMTVGAFTFGISTATPNINFTAATTATTLAPYIFDGLSLLGPTISTSTGQSLAASDVFAVLNSGTTLGAGVTVGLGHVLFNVSSAAAVGPITVSLAPFPSTSLANATGGNIPINSLVNGTITVGSTTAVPEPATLASAITALAFGAWPLWRSRRRPAAVAGNPPTLSQ
jgi:hypothetical protein